MAKVKQAALKSSGQQELIDAILQGLKGGEGPLQDIFGAFNQGEFEQGVTQPALKNFQENILPLLQEKFIANNQAGGSDFRDAGLKASTDLQSQLAALMYQAQQQQKQNRIGGVNNASNLSLFENIVSQPKNKSSILESLIPALGGVAGAFVGGPGGAAAGTGIANAAQKLFGGGGGAQAATVGSGQAPNAATPNYTQVG